MTKGWRLTCCTARNKAMGSFTQRPFNYFIKRFIINFSIYKRGDKRWYTSLEHYVNNFLAERVGFEPTEGITPFGNLANCWFKPLTHLSYCLKCLLYFFIIFLEDYVQRKYLEWLTKRKKIIKVRIC